MLVFDQFTDGIIGLALVGGVAVAAAGVVLALFRKRNLDQ